MCSLQVVSLRAQENALVAKEVEFKSVDGMKIFGKLYRPQTGSSFPAIVRVHGGVHGQIQPRTQDFFVDNGFVVLDVDYRGSSGHGKDYRNKLEMNGREVDDILFGGKFLQGLPYVNPEKLAILGDSRGAYITYCAISRPNPFKVAVAINGFTDLIQQYEYEAEIAPNFMLIQEIMGASPSTHPDRFKELSPIHFADKVNVPILIVHGNNDHLVLVDQARKMAEALAQHQKESDFIVLYSPEADTGHTLRDKGLTLAEQYSLNWINRHLFPTGSK